MTNRSEITDVQDTVEIVSSFAAQRNLARFPRAIPAVTPRKHQTCAPLVATQRGND